MGKRTTNNTIKKNHISVPIDLLPVFFLSFLFFFPFCPFNAHCVVCVRAWACHDPVHIAHHLFVSTLSFLSLYDFPPSPHFYFFFILRLTVLDELISFFLLILPHGMSTCHGVGLRSFYLPFLRNTAVVDVVFLNPPSLPQRQRGKERESRRKG